MEQFSKNEMKGIQAQLDLFIESARTIDKRAKAIRAHRKNNEAIKRTNRVQRKMRKELKEKITKYNRGR